MIRPVGRLGDVLKLRWVLLVPLASWMVVAYLALNSYGSDNVYLDLMQLQTLYDTLYIYTLRSLLVRSSNAISFYAQPYHGFL